MSTALLPRSSTLARLIELRARVALAVRANEADAPTAIEGVLVAASAHCVTLYLRGVGNIEIPTSSLCSFRMVTALPPLAVDEDARTPPPC